MLLEEIKEKIVDKYDPDDICDALEITTQELLDAFEAKLVAEIDKFEVDELPNVAPWEDKND